ncbi:MAG: hypothetical protein K8R69_04490, partial [Deltaproteobacteria bacterium]|nr:hypothetical protein [Deltaproteobacteria bacterium]
LGAEGAGRVKDLLKYTILGAMGLALSLCFPQIRIDWMAIVLAQAFVNSKNRFSPWFCLAVLAWLYSSFSFASSWQLVLPVALAAAVFFAFRKNFSMGPAARRGWLLGMFLASQSVFWSLNFALRGQGWFLTWGDGFWAAATLAAGLFLLPAFSRLLRKLLLRFAAFGRSAGSMDLRRAEWLSAKVPRLSRKPFGLEKGI